MISDIIKVCKSIHQKLMPLLFLVLRHVLRNDAPWGQYSSLLTAGPKASLVLKG